jgi:hypothetical protein
MTIRAYLHKTFKEFKEISKREPFLKYAVTIFICLNLIALFFNLIYFGLVLLLWPILGYFYYVARESYKHEEKKAQKIKEKFGNRIVDRNKTLIDRNEDIIQKYLNNLYIDEWPLYYVENEVRDCIADIALAEGKNEFAPIVCKDSLIHWSMIKALPKEWLYLKDDLMKRFYFKIGELKQMKRTLEEEAQQERRSLEEEAVQALNLLKEKKWQELLERNKNYVDKSLDIAERKVSVIDDYGDENWEALPDEVLACLKKISQREGMPLNIEEYLKGKQPGIFDNDTRSLLEQYKWLQRQLAEIFKEYHQALKTKPAINTEVNNLSGVEFEIWISKLLKENGFKDVCGTTATGDQGADLIAKKDRKTIIIQAKRYQGTVGNKAVQEVISAIQYYKGDEGWVITNSTFSPSAKALAQVSNIKLIDGNMLRDIGKYLK